MQIALDALHWNREEAQFVLCGKLTYACVSESHCSTKARGKTCKFLQIHALLVTLGQPTSLYRPDLVNSDAEHELTSGISRTGIKGAALVLVREKNGRFTLCRVIRLDVHALTGSHLQFLSCDCRTHSI